jgi:hypothetical protein
MIDDTIAGVREGFYPPVEWAAYPQVHDCPLVRVKRLHEAHFWIPGLLGPEDLEAAPDFICGGWYKNGRRIIDIEEARDRRNG